MLGKPPDRVGGDRHHRPRWNVVEGDRQRGGVGDRGEMRDQALLRGPRVVRRHDEQTVRARVLGGTRQFDANARCRRCPPRRRWWPGRRRRRRRPAAGPTFSVSVVVGDSPVVPEMTSRSTPPSTRCAASATPASTSSLPVSGKGGHHRDTDRAGRAQLHWRRFTVRHGQKATRSPDVPRHPSGRSGGRWALSTLRDVIDDVTLMSWT